MTPLLPHIPAGRARRPRAGERGLTLLEVLVAAALACGLAAAAYTWLWGAGGACARETRAADAQSRLAAVHRRLALDMAQALGLVRPPDGLGEWRFAVRLVETDGTVRDLEYCWDPGRRVLWRSASSSYLADGVVAFAVEYLDERGEPVDPSSLPVDADGRVSGAAALGVSATAVAGASVADAAWVFPLPPARL